MCVQPLGLSLCELCVEKLFLQATPQLQAQSRARLRCRKSVFPERSLTEFRIARAVPYGTPKSLTEFLQSGFAAEIPGRKSLMEFLLTIQSRYGIDSETPIAIRIPYGIGNLLPKSLRQVVGKVARAQLAKFPGRHPTLPQHGMKQTRNLLISDRLQPMDNPCTL